LVIYRGDVVIVTDHLAVAMEIDERWCSLAMDIKATRNGDIPLYRNKIVAGIGRRCGEILPGVKDEGKDHRLIQDGIISLLRHIFLLD